MDISLKNHRWIFFFISRWNVMREGIWAVWKYPLLHIMLQVIWELGVLALLNWKNIWAAKCCLYHQQAWENKSLWASMLQIRRCHLIAGFYLQIENEKEKDRWHQWEKTKIKDLGCTSLFFLHYFRTLRH